MKPESKKLLEEAEKLASMGSLLDALGLCDRILSSDAHNQEACVMAGAIHGELGQFSQAEQSLRKAQALAPGDVTPYLILSHLLRSQGKAAEAIENLKTAVSNGTKDAEVFCFLGSMQHEAGSVLDAIESFEAAHDINDADDTIKQTLTSMRIQHADFLEKKGDHEMSLELVRPLLESDDPPLDAVLILAKLSPFFDTYDDCRYLLRRFQERAGLTEVEHDTINQALAWLDSTQ